MTIHNLNGTSLYAIKEGRGEPVVFMHGFGLDHRMWDQQTNPLRDHFTVIRYDLRGFGRSALPDPQVPYTHEDDYLALLRHFELDRAHLVALSMGGRMALRCATICPQAMSSLILLDSAMDGHTWSTEWQLEWNNLVAAAREDSLDAARMLWMRHSLFASANTNAVLTAQLKTMVEQYSGWHWINKDPATTPQPPATHRLADIDIPTLVVTGEFDLPDFHEIAGKLSREIPNARRLVVPQAGHMVNMESPDIVNAAILNFLNKMK
ncbi:MAG TPA: alpha/beta hydrolase [Puia sp.]|jgi:3-oxoadipate enol-lactonase|nr:alpha/beta hydrolase [Puia sp.]